ncbi:MAG: UbiA family prenyltransferase [Candidatus Odinarchaeota archaeon]
MTLQAIHKLIRTQLCIMATFAGLVGAFVAYRIEIRGNITEFFLYDPLIILIGVFVPFLMVAGSNAINDYVDLEGDIANQRHDRPLVTGELSKSTALVIAIIGLVIGPLISIVFNKLEVLIAVVIISFLSLSYSLWFKKTGFIGNCVVALILTSPFVLGAVVISVRKIETIATIAAIMIISFTGGLAREIAKGIMDVDGDRKEGVKTVAVVHGPRAAALLSVVLQLVTALLFPLPYLFGFSSNVWYLISIIPPIGFILYLSWRLINDQSVETGRMARKLARYALYTGIMAFVVGAVL